MSQFGHSSERVHPCPSITTDFYYCLMHGDETACILLAWMVAKFSKASNMHVNKAKEEAQALLSYNRNELDVFLGSSLSDQLAETVS